MRMKDRTQAIVRFLKQQWIVLWLLVAISGLTAVVVYAIYSEGENKIKRVVAPAAELGGLFTSNQLMVGGGSKSVYYQESDTPPFEFPLEIRNYNVNDPDTKYQGTIEYSLTARLVHMNETPYTLAELPETSDWNATDAPMSIAIELNNDKIELKGNAITGSLGAETKYTLTSANPLDSWTVTFTNIPLDTDYCVEITAVPVNQDLENLSQVIGISSVPEIYTEGWSCVIADDTSKSVNSYDAFNYTITGTGKKDLKFSYDSSVLEINPSFCEYLTEASIGNYSGSTTENRSGWKTILIHADPDQTFVNRYDFQMYKVGTFSPGSFDDLKPEESSYIEFEQASPAP